MRYEWDPWKARANDYKHGVDFADAVTVLEDDLALTLDDRASGEDRIGLDATGRLLVVVYTWRGDRVRVISARKANKVERRQYEAGR